jgi:hypothetical protein
VCAQAPLMQTRSTVTSSARALLLWSPEAYTLASQACCSCGTAALRWGQAGGGTAPQLRYTLNGNLTGCRGVHEKL